jgi:hypothetical protein
MADGGIAQLNYDPYQEMMQQAMASRMMGLPASSPTASKKGGRVKKSKLPSVAQGDLGSYSDGGRLLQGPGDGMSDSIPADIAGQRPARLADSEFVIPADVVSHLGNGSSDAGARQLYAMMDRVRKARTGSAKQGKQINPQKFVPA